jgi:LytTr DNA-binding domain
VSDTAAPHVLDATPSRLALNAGFYLGVPIFIAFAFTWISAGQMAQHLPRDIALLYWLGLFMPKWLAMDLATRLVSRAGRRWSPAPWLCALTGAVIGCIAYKPLAVAYLDMFLGAFGSYMPAEFAFVGVEPIWPGSLDAVGTMIIQNGVSIGLWTFAVVAYVRVWGVPAYLRPAPAAVAGVHPWIQPAQPRLPVFMQRTRGLAEARLLAIQAEDHYIRVITDSGDDLVLYRFSDALEELAQRLGYRVHRSYWIAKDAVSAVECENKNYIAILANGLRVPISRSNIGLLRAEGLISG